MFSKVVVLFYGEHLFRDVFIYCMCEQVCAPGPQVWKSEASQELVLAFHLSESLQLNSGWQAWQQVPLPAVADINTSKFPNTQG